MVLRTSLHTSRWWKTVKAYDITSGPKNAVNTSPAPGARKLFVTYKPVRDHVIINILVHQMVNCLHQKQKKKKKEREPYCLCTICYLGLCKCICATPHSDAWMTGGNMMSNQVQFQSFDLWASQQYMQPHSQQLLMWSLGAKTFWKLLVPCNQTEILRSKVSTFKVVSPHFNQQSQIFQDSFT